MTRPAKSASPSRCLPRTASALRTMRVSPAHSAAYALTRIREELTNHVLQNFRTWQEARCRSMVFVHRLATNAKGAERQPHYLPKLVKW